MSLVLHIIHADVRRFRWLIAAWVVVIAASFALQGISPFLYEWRGVGEPLRATEGLMLLARLLVGTTLVVLLVQTHPLVGTTAFWMTRPIPPGVLLRAKLLLIGTLLLGLPAMAEAVLMAAFRVPGAQIGRVLADSTLVRAMLMVAVVALAGLTRSFARFALLCGAIIVAVVLLINIVIFVEVWRATPVASFVVARPTMLGFLLTPRDATPDVVGTLAFIAGALWLIRAEYWRRSRRRVVALVLSVPLLALAVWFVWPWQLLQAAPRVPAWTEELQLRAPTRASAVARQPELSGRTPWRLVWLDVTASGVPDGWLASARLLAATFRTGGEEVESFPGSYPVLLRDYPDSPPSDQALFAELLGATPVVWTFGVSSTEGPIALSLPDTALPPHALSGVYRGEFEIDLMRADVVASLPLEPGAGFQDGAYRLVLDDVDIGDALWVRVRVSQAVSSFDGAPPPTYLAFVRHAKSRTAVGGDTHAVGQFSPFTASVFGWSLYVPGVAGFRPRAERMIFRHVTAGAAGAAPRDPFGSALDDTWLSETDLVFVRVQHGATLRRTVEIPELMLPEPRMWRLEGRVDEVQREFK